MNFKNVALAQIIRKYNKILEEKREKFTVLR